ncbi:MAG: branched-chain amino acid ABC transporter permease [Actinomycetota bacterium]|nr:branched-chain amino acid ABC transporter permease [Actinomycetota bacterium]
MRWASPFVAVAIPVALFAVAPKLYPNLLFLVTMMVYVVLAQGVNVIYGFTGYLPFGYVGFFGVGAYASSLAILDTGVPAPVGVVVGAAGAVLLGLLLSPLLRLSGAYFAIATLAAALAVESVISNPSLAGITKGPYGIDLGSVYNARADYVAGLVMVGLSMAVVVYLRRSRFGLALRAIRNDPVSAAAAGVDVVKERMLAWLISSALAGAAGAVFAWGVSVFYPTAVFGISTSVFAIVFALFGGVGTAWGPLVGTAVLFGLYQAIGVSDPQYAQGIYGLLIVALVLFVPGGLAGVARSIRRRRA